MGNQPSLTSNEKARITPDILQSVISRSAVVDQTLSKLYVANLAAGVFSLPPLEQPVTVTQPVMETVVTLNAAEAQQPDSLIDTAQLNVDVTDVEPVMAQPADVEPEMAPFVAPEMSTEDSDRAAMIADALQKAEEAHNAQLSA